jgi:hypothetical protein
LSISGAAAIGQRSMFKPNEFFYLQLITYLEKRARWYIDSGETQLNSKPMNLLSKVPKKDPSATPHHSNYFHHYIKSISLAVLALFTFWWWYHSIWLCGFVMDINNTKHLYPPFSNHRSRQKHTLTKCETSECVISAMKNVTYLSNTRSTFVLPKKYQKHEKLMYLIER